MSGDHVISVVPVEGGWSLECATGLNPLLFLSGGRAEENAHALAKVFAELGRDVRILVHDRQKALIGTALYFADEAMTAQPTP